MMGTVTHVTTQDPVVALTFDDGPHPESTPRLLDILEKHGAHATFFMVGEAAQRHPDIVRRVAEAGHAIGNHSWDHSSLPLLSGKERRAQIRACEKALAPYGQRLFRPPYGHQSLASRLDALGLGYQVVTWSVTASDWQDRDAQWITDRLTDETSPGDIVLFHDALYTYVEKRYTDREPTLQAVDLLLECLGERFRFVTVPELLRSGEPQRRNWYQEADVDWLNRLGGAFGEPRRYVRSSGR
jgi:peptidoglycan/xylan/chitin deacetylase (PgdA/CDA1 family)